MRNHSRKHRLNNSGLTLIELIVAIAIIAIFSGVVLTYITCLLYTSDAADE